MPWRKSARWLGLEFGLGLTLGLKGQFPSGAIVLEAQYEQFQLYLLLALTSFGTLVMKENSFFNSDLKVILVVVVPASCGRFTFWLSGLSGLDYFTIFIFLSIFQKIRKCIKMLFQKIIIISPCFLYIKKKIIKKLLKSILYNFLEILQHRHFVWLL